MKPLPYFLAFIGLLALETILCVLLPQIRDSGVSISVCTWIAFYIPLALVFGIFSFLVFRDDRRRGFSRLFDAAAGGILASLLWFGIVFFVGVKVTGAGTLVTVEGNTQPVAAPNERH